MSLRLACADFTFPLLDHDRVLDLIALLDFQGVDVGLFEGRSHLWPSRVFEDLRGSARTLAGKLRDRGLEAADIYLQTAPDFVSLAPNHPDPAKRKQARDWFERAVEFATECGARHVSALPGVAFEEEPAADSWRRCCDELAWRCEAARAQGVVFSVEAHVGSIAPTPAAAAELVRDVPGLTLTLDYTHFTRDGRPDSEIEPLIAHSSHFHARCARPGRLQTSFKENAIDYGRVLDVMKQVGYSGFVGVEYVWIDWEHCNEVDNLSETILLRDHLREHAKAR
ncbi:sugar phosphate isomerase/epimerase family protein [Paludisphaera mucosa]|uniref:Sugar phosphate isomerase/epimerase n=1 Tax=Paludisphaera mucosa TaxID=3030827 RepID=A0ABT6FEY7_9BACT|nr:sugar phosphate isomerase/epimerase [Paludisphaera mucosa]MDG3006092.1 sugar phosphate isomerase/epimerase [Paludisphaera mucosa]